MRGLLAADSRRQAHVLAAVARLAAVRRLTATCRAVAHRQERRRRSASVTRRALLVCKQTRAQLNNTSSLWCCLHTAWLEDQLHGKHPFKHKKFDEHVHVRYQ